MSVILKIDLATRKLLNFPARISRGGPRLLKVAFYNGPTPTLLADGATVVLELFVPDDLENPIPGSVLSSWNRNDNALTYAATLEAGQGLLGGLSYPTLYGRVTWAEPDEDVVRSELFHVLFSAAAQEGADQAIPWERLVGVPTAFPAETPLPISAGAVTYSSGTVASAILQQETGLAETDARQPKTLRAAGAPGVPDFNQREAIQALLNSAAGVVTLPPGTWHVTSGRLEIPRGVTLRGDGGLIKVSQPATLLINGKIEGLSQVFELDHPDQVDPNSQPQCPARPEWFDWRVGWANHDEIDAWHALQCCCRGFSDVDAPGLYAVQDTISVRNGTAIWGSFGGDLRGGERPGITRRNMDQPIFRCWTGDGATPASHNGVHSCLNLYGLRIFDTTLTVSGAGSPLKEQPLIDLRYVAGGRFWQCDIEGPVGQTGCRYGFLSAVSLWDTRFTECKFTGGGVWDDATRPQLRFWAHSAGAGGYTSSEIHLIHCHFEAFNGTAVSFEDGHHSNHIYATKFEAHPNIPDGQMARPLVVWGRGTSGRMVDCYTLTGENGQMLQDGHIMVDSMWGLKISGHRFGGGGNIAWSQFDRFATVNSGCIVGQRYKIDQALAPGVDCTNIGAPNNDDGTMFVATGAQPAAWGSASGPVLRRVPKSDQYYLRGLVVFRGVSTGVEIDCYLDSVFAHATNLHSILVIDNKTMSRMAIKARQNFWAPGPNGNPDNTAFKQMFPDASLTDGYPFYSPEFTPMVIDTQSSNPGPVFAAGNHNRLLAIETVQTDGLTTKIQQTLKKTDGRGIRWEASKDVYAEWDTANARIHHKKRTHLEAGTRIFADRFNPLVIYNSGGASALWQFADTLCLKEDFVEADLPFPSGTEHAIRPTAQP